MARGIRCPKCKSENCNIQMVEVGAKTKKSGVGIVGNTYNVVRGAASIVTLGIAGKIMPKATGKEKTKNSLVKMALCQNCGHSWEIK